MKKVVVVALGVPLMLAACGSTSGSGAATGGGAGHPVSPAAAVDPASPEGMTDHAVADLLAAVPLPPGAHPATASEARHIDVASSSASDNRVDRHATYAVPMSIDDVIDWYDAHPPPGTKASGSGYGSDHGVLTSRSLSFDAQRRNPAYDALEADVNVQPHGDDAAVLRIDAQAEWLPDATQARVPGGATSVDVVQVTDDHAVHRATLGQQPARRLADLINRQHVAGPGQYNCPMDRGAHDVLTFHGTWPVRRYAVGAEGCGFIDVKVAGKKLDVSFFGGDRVNQLVTRLLSSRR